MFVIYNIIASKGIINEYLQKKYQILLYKVLFEEKDAEEQWHETGLYNLTLWFAKMKKKMHTNIELSDCMVSFDNISQYHDGEYYVVRLFKLRDVNVPSKIKDGEVSQPIPLDPDEYIGEDVFLLYDRENSICMFQQNRMSLSIGKMSEWVNKDLGTDQRVVFKFISDKFTPKRMKRKNIRSIDLSFANMIPDDEHSPLAELVKGIQRYDGIQAKITISVGRRKYAQLNNQIVYDLVNDIQNNPGIVNKAHVKLKDMHDDDKSRVEIVDILDNALHDYIEVDIEVRKPLEYDLARSRVMEQYVKRREAIVALVQE